MTPTLSNDLSHANGGDSGWYPRFDKVLNAATTVNWGTTDLFPQYGDGPATPDPGGLALVRPLRGNVLRRRGKSVCPAVNAHDGSRSGHYRVMFNSAFPYGQNGWRYCKKCGGLHYGGFGRHLRGGPETNTHKESPGLVLQRPPDAGPLPGGPGRTTGRAASTTAWRTCSVGLRRTAH